MGIIFFLLTDRDTKTAIERFPGDDNRFGRASSPPPLRSSPAGLEGAGSISALAERTVILPSPLESLYEGIHVLAIQIRATHRIPHWAEGILLAVGAGVLSHTGAKADY